jgi:hypothetical protein
MVRSCADPDAVDHDDETPVAAILPASIGCESIS